MPRNKSSRADNVFSGPRVGSRDVFLRREDLEAQGRHIETLNGEWDQVFFSPQSGQVIKYINKESNHVYNAPGVAWHADLPDASLRSLCCEAGLECAQASREELIEGCNVIANLTEATAGDLRKSCLKQLKARGWAASAIADEEKAGTFDGDDKNHRNQLMQCVFRARVDEQTHVITNKAKKVKSCPPGQRKPKEDDTCPLGFTKTGEGCCKPNFKRMAKISILTIDFVETMLAIPDDKQYRQILDASDMTSKDKERAALRHAEQRDLYRKLINDHRDADAERQYALMEMLKEIQDGLMGKMSRIESDMRKYMVAPSDVQSQTWFGSAVHVAWSSVKFIAGWAAHIVKAIATSPWTVMLISNPATMRIATYALLQIKRRVCREVALQIGWTKKIPPKTLITQARETVEGAGNWVQESLPSMVQGLTSGEKWHSMWSSVASPMFTLTSETLSSLPLVGGFVKGTMKIVEGVAEDTMREVVQYKAYEAAMGGTLVNLTKILLDWDTCIAEVETKEEKAPAAAQHYQGNTTSRRQSLRRRSAARR